MTSKINYLEKNVKSEDQVMDRANGAMADEVSKEIVMHHLKSFLNNDVEAVLSDYTSESVLVTQAATYSSLETIRSFFVGLNIHFPKHQSNFILDKIVASDDLVFIVWHANTPSLQVPIGSDTFIIKEGKIHQQTFAGQLNFINQ